MSGNEGSTKLCTGSKTVRGVGNTRASEPPLQKPALLPKYKILKKGEKLLERDGHCRTVVDGIPNDRQLKVNVRLVDTATLQTYSHSALIDPGCMNSTIDEEWVRVQGMTLSDLEHPIYTRNVDRTLNGSKPVQYFVRLRMDMAGHAEEIILQAGRIPGDKVILGYDWIRKHNPEVDWQENRLWFLQCPQGCGMRLRMVRALGVDKKPDWVRLYPEVFAEEVYDRLPKHQPGTDIDLHLKDPAAPPFTDKIYPLTNREKEALDYWLDENLRTGRIKLSTSAYASPLFFKDEGDKLRPIIDYRKLNERCVKNRYPLPLIRETIDSLKDLTIFTKLDVKWGFNNIRIREEDEAKAAFVTYRGLFQPTVMQFRLQNAPAVFQNFMNIIFIDEIRTGHVKVYVDDILIYTNDQALHHELTHRVLRKLRDNNLCV